MTQVIHQSSSCGGLAAPGPNSDHLSGPVPERPGTAPWRAPLRHFSWMLRQVVGCDSHVTRVKVTFIDEEGLEKIKKDWCFLKKLGSDVLGSWLYGIRCAPFPDCWDGRLIAVFHRSRWQYSTNDDLEKTNQKTFLPDFFWFRWWLYAIRVVIACAHTSCLPMPIVEAPLPNYVAMVCLIFFTEMNHRYNPLFFVWKEELLKSTFYVREFIHTLRKLRF